MANGMRGSISIVGGSGGVVGEGGADFVDVGAVGADGFVEDLAVTLNCWTSSDVGGDFGVDLFRVLGPLVWSSWMVWNSWVLGTS